MNSDKQLLRRTLAANKKIHLCFLSFIKLNIDMHDNTTNQFISMIDAIIILLTKSQFQFKHEILNEWTTLKYRVHFLQFINYDQIRGIEGFIDSFIFVDNYTSNLTTSNC
jgi:hypothetical protein